MESKYHRLPGENKAEAAEDELALALKPELTENRIKKNVPGR
jgi:hypothetical protein